MIYFLYHGHSNKAHITEWLWTCKALLPVMISDLMASGCLMFREAAILCADTEACRLWLTAQMFDIVTRGMLTLIHGHRDPDSKVHGANMGPTWVLSAPDEPHVGPTNLAIRGDQCKMTDICPMQENSKHVPFTNLYPSSAMFLGSMSTKHSGLIHVQPCQHYIVQGLKWDICPSSHMYRKISNIRLHQIPKLKCFLSQLAVVFIQYIEAKCYVENEDVVWAAPISPIRLYRSEFPKMVLYKIRVICYMAWINQEQWSKLCQWKELSKMIIYDLTFIVMV